MYTATQTMLLTLDQEDAEGRLVKNTKRRRNVFKEEKGMKHKKWKNRQEKETGIHVIVSFFSSSLFEKQLRGHTE